MVALTERDWLGGRTQPYSSVSLGIQVLFTAVAAEESPPGLAVRRGQGEK